MNKNEIRLHFDKLQTNLAGNRYGHDIYVNQVKKYIKNDSINIVIIPDNIEDVASSFIEGIYKEIGEERGKVNATEFMRIYAENREAANKIDEIFETYGI